MSDKVQIDLELVTKSFEAALKNATESTKKFGTESEKAFNKSTSAWDVFVGSISSQVAIKAFEKITSALTGFITSAAEIETTTIRFETLTGSAEKAKNLMEDLVKFAAQTPFEMQGIADVSAKLLSFGFTVDQIPERLKRIGDVAASSGASLQEIGLIFGQVASAGKLTGERLLQFQERAIPIMPALAKQFQKSEAEIRQAITDGKISFADFERAFFSLSDAGGQAFGGMEKQSKTFNGLISTMKDSFTLLGAEIGSAFLPQAKEFVNILISAADAGSIFIKNLGQVSKPKDDIKGLTEQISFFESKLAELRAQSEGEGIIEKIFKGGKTQEAVATYEHNIEILKLKLSELSDAELARNSITVQSTVVADQQKLESARMTLGEIEKIFQSQLDILTANYEEQRAIEAENENISFEDKLAREEQYFEARNVLLEQQYQEELKTIEASKQSEAEKNEAKRLMQAKYHSASIKAQSDFSKKIMKMEEDQAKMEEDMRNQKLAAVSGLFGALASVAALGGKKNFEIVKAFNLAEAVTAGWLAVQKALASAPPPTNYIAASAAGIAAAANVARISSTSAPKFQDGGVVPGSSFVGDKVTARVNSGEMILNKSQQANLFQMVRAGRGSGNSDAILERIASAIEASNSTSINIDGREIINVVRNGLAAGRTLT